VLKKRVFTFIPPPAWRFPVGVLLISFVVIGLYTAVISNATAYLSDDPQACVNCHVMTPQYLTWKHSSHRNVANCNDCHVPNDSQLKKYAFKAIDGLYHSFVFTTRSEPQVIKARQASIDVIQANCVRCHENQVTDVKTNAFVEKHKESRTTRLCWECHREVPHGRTKSLSATKYMLESTFNTSEEHKIVPDWLKGEIDKSK